MRTSSDQSQIPGEPSALGSAVCDADPDNLELLRKRSLDFLQNSANRLDWKDFYYLAHKTQAVELQDGQWLTGSYDGARAVLEHRESSLRAFFPVTRSPELNELFLSLLPHEYGAAHHRLRSIVQPLFSRSLLSRLHPLITSQIESRLYPALFDSTGFDVSNLLCSEIPEIVSCLLLDAHPADWRDLGNAARKMYKQIGRYHQEPEELDDAEAAYAYIRRHVSKMCESEHLFPNNGIGRELVSLYKNEKISDRELLGYFCLFLFTGLDTLSNAVSNTLWFIGASPEVFQSLKTNPHLTQLAVDEIMRLLGTYSSDALAISKSH